MDIPLRPRAITFEDLSGTLARVASVDQKDQRQQLGPFDGVPVGSMKELAAQLAAIASDVQEAHGTMQERVDGHRRAALDQLDATGGRQALESHLKAQKANWKFLGQREAFLERLKVLRNAQELLQHDFSSDVSIADKAVQTLKEEIRERNAGISKTEQQLASTIQQITRLYDVAGSTAGQLAMQLPRIAAELEEYQAGREQPPAAAVDGNSEAELLRMVAEEEAQAAALEQQAALEAANWAAEVAERGALEACVRELREDVEALEEECSAAARKQGAEYSEQLQWYEALSAAASRLTGVELAGADGVTLHLTITQTIPRAMPGRESYPAPGSGGGTSASQAATAAGSSSLDPSASAAEAAGAGAVVAEHVLSLEFAAPGSALLRGATLNPPAVDISDDVRAALAAQDAGSGAAERAAALSGLLLDVKARVRLQCRRQLQLEDAHELYPLQPTDVSPELVRCVLPNKVEVEVEVPLSWPEEPGTHLALVTLQAPRASQDLAPLLARLQAELVEAQQSGGGGGSGGCGGAVGSGGGGAQAEVRRRQLQGCGLRELLDWVFGCLAAEMGK